MRTSNGDAGQGQGAAERDLHPDVPTGEEAMLFCPVCSTRLVSLRCKLLCENCGYYMSCADYY